MSSQAIATADILRNTGLAGNTADGSRAYAIVESQTTQIGQHLAGTPPADRAAEWAKAKFEKLCYDKVYTEPVSFPLWLRGVEEASVVATK